LHCKGALGQETGSPRRCAQLDAEWFAGSHLGHLADALIIDWIVTIPRTNVRCQVGEAVGVMLKEARHGSGFDDYLEFSLGCLAVGSLPRPPKNLERELAGPVPDCQSQQTAASSKQACSRTEAGACVALLPSFQSSILPIPSPLWRTTNQTSRTIERRCFRNTPKRYPLQPCTALPR
jgi:hypothetical protein